MTSNKSFADWDKVFNNHVLRHHLENHWCALSALPDEGRALPPPNDARPEAMTTNAHDLNRLTA
jgi:hypothetical protein